MNPDPSDFEDFKAAHDDAADAWTDNWVGRDPRVPADQLMGNPVNPRIHPTRQQKAMYEILRRLGWVGDVIVNQRTGRIIDGHMRVLIAITHGKTVPVTYIDVSEQAEREIIATYDQVARLAVIDADLFEDLIDSTNDWGASIEKMFAEVSPASVEPKAATSDEDATPNLEDVTYGMVGWGETKVKCTPEEIEMLTKLHMQYRAENGGNDEGWATWLIQYPHD